MAEIAPIVDAARSPYAARRPLPFSAVLLEGGFWSGRRLVNGLAALPHGHAELVATGVLRNFARSIAGERSGYEGKRYADSDLYKWIEAVSYELGRAGKRGGEIESALDGAVDLIEGAQESSGYLYTYYQVLREERDRWRHLDTDHELYCAGHLFQAALAHFRCTGERRLAGVARKLADELCRSVGPGKIEGLPGHPGIEMALVEMYRAFGDPSYLALARYFVDARGKGLCGGASYNQDHVPVRRAREIAGHAVMQLYLLCGAADVYLETGDSELLGALERLWDDLVLHKMSISGGVGARHELESFGEPYELPNDRIYNETCAQIAAVMWSWRMLLATGKARYADHLEWTLYNGVLSGVSLDGTAYFYPNPLRSRGSPRRSPWFDCACCPPNVMRTLASMQSYVATTSDGAVQLHLYDRARISAALPSGERLDVRLDTDYPWRGAVRIFVERVESAREIELSLRIPGWCRRAGIRVNGRDLPGPIGSGSYRSIRRAWKAGDQVLLDMEVAPVLYVAHPLVEPARSCGALARGPILYCIEQTDQVEGASVLASTLAPGEPIGEESDDSLLEGLVTLSVLGGGSPAPASESEPLYRQRGASDEPADGGVPFFTAARARGGGGGGRIPLRATPYFAWANRSPGPMAVWLPLEDR